MINVVCKRTNGWKDFDTACVGISMHSVNHQGEILEGTLGWVRSNFKKYIIDISDTLNRHNYIGNGMYEAEAMAKARQDGDDWLENHLHLLPADARIIRWNHWLNHSSFAENLESFRTSYRDQPQFKDAVISDAIHFYKRKNINPATITALSMKSSINYLLEELSVHSIFYQENRCAIIYPAKQHDCYKMVRKGLVKNVPSGLNNSFYARLFVYNFDNNSNAASIKQAA